MGAETQVNAVPDVRESAMPPSGGQVPVNGGYAGDAGDLLDFSALPDAPDEGLANGLVLPDGLDPFLKDWLADGGVDFFNL